MQNSSTPSRQFNRSLKPLLLALTLLVIVLTAFTWYRDHQRLQGEVKRLSDQLTAQKAAEIRLQEEQHSSTAPIHERADREVLRAKLEGRPITVTGMKTDGSAFEWSEYLGKIVLVHCWSAVSVKLSSPDDFPWIKELYEDYRDVGLHVVSLSVDPPSAHDEARVFLQAHDIHWTNLLPTPAQSPQVNGSRIEWPRTLILVNRDGTVASVLVSTVESERDKDFAEVRVEGLRSQLDRILGRRGEDPGRISQ